MQFFLNFFSQVNHDQEETEFCASQCPTLLISSRDYCSEFNRATEMTNIMNRKKVAFHGSNDNYYNYYSIFYSVSYL